MYVYYISIITFLLESCLKSVNSEDGGRNARSVSNLTILASGGGGAYMPPLAHICVYLCKHMYESVEKT